MRRMSWLLRRAATFAAVGLIAFGSVSLSGLQGASIAYYNFDGTANDVDGVGAINNLNLNQSTITAGSQGMFGEAFSNDPANTTTTGVAGLPDSSAGEFDVAFSNFSAGLWVKTNLAHTGVAPATTNSSSRFFITGKQGGGGNRGWQLSNEPTSAGIDQFQVFFYPSAGSSAINLFRTKMTSALSSTDFHHVVTTFESTGPSAGTVNIYVNGIAQALEFTNSTSTTATFSNTNTTTTSGAWNGSNARSFEIGHRGESATANATNEYTGLVDDYTLASDLYTPQFIALTHGLGRLAGVSFGELNDSITNTEILDVLAAYNAQSSAEAGERMWIYSSSLAQGNVVGTIGGTVAGDNAFIVLGTDGSGVAIIPVPELSTCSLACVGFLGLGLIRKRRKQ